MEVSKQLKIFFGDSGFIFGVRCIRGCLFGLFLLLLFFFFFFFLFFGKMSLARYQFFIFLTSCWRFCFFGIKLVWVVSERGTLAVNIATVSFAVVILLSLLFGQLTQLVELTQLAEKKGEMTTAKDAVAIFAVRVPLSDIYCQRTFIYYIL